MVIAVPERSAASRFADLTARSGLCFGGDYNPEQWPADVWREDARLMREARVNLVTVGVFSWARYEPRPGAREFDWLDEVLDVLDEHGIGVDLATPTASPPPWLGARHPGTLPVDAEGVRLVPGSRNQFSPASSVYREHALAITTDLVVRYANHPAVRMWHVGNEFGQVCYGDEAAAAFREWLRDRYGSVEALDDAWGTAVWSQRYDDWSEVLPPRRMPYHPNPSQALDWRRFCSDQLLGLYRAQRDVIRAHDTERPVTTNLMGFFAGIDPWTWADDLDVVSDDAYPDPGDPQAPADAALTQDLVRSLGGGAPWLLMESATSAVSWRPHNLPKSPERSRLESLQAVARGADGVCFFQWRGSRSGAERFHSSMLPLAGADTRVHRGVRRLGADLERLRPVVGGRVEARVAIVVDWPSWWASGEVARPTDRLDAVDQLRAWHRVLWEHHVVCDLVPPARDLAGYDLVLVPQLYLLEEVAAQALTDAARRGAVLVVGPFTGVADERAHLRTGRFPALLRDVLGVSGEEHAALPDDGVPLDLAPRWPGRPGAGARASVLGELLRADGADVLATYRAGHLAGAPAVTRHGVGQGEAWYVGTVLDQRSTADVLLAALRASAAAPVLPGLPAHPGVEIVRRGDVLFLLNHSPDRALVPVPGPHVDLLTGEPVTGVVDLPGHDAVALVDGPIERTS
ncbi:beta-galactosidase [Oerskovia flava]|uniref:beta-galactosidase n=1 Tax=Oerskovia flava TaxID=2986422 RepID=UPI00223ED683|nr:beta-galactosidase [Oerskovia sp. JB1-3-2]